MKRRVVPLTAGALVGIAALAVWSGASAKPVLAGPAGGAAGASCYTDAVGDAGDAPDITLVRISSVAASVQIDVRLAGPTELGPYGWILIGLDTDRNPFTGGGRGDELLTFTNGVGTTLTRWVDGHFTPDYPHHRFAASFSGTDLRLTFARADVRARSFEFSVASLREEADIAPGAGVAAYPGGPFSRCGDSSRARTQARATYHVVPRKQVDGSDPSRQTSLVQKGGVMKSKSARALLFPSASVVAALSVGAARADVPQTPTVPGPSATQTTDR